MFGRELRAPIDVVFGCPNGSDYGTWNEFVDMLQAGLRESYDLAREQLGRAAERNKHTYNMRVRPVQFPIGTWVWFYNARRYVG